jgi:hypothetical protein
MSRKLLVALVLANVATGVVPSNAVVNTGCTASTYAGITTVNKSAKSANATADVVDANAMDVYTITLTEAGDHYLAVQGIGGDVDMAVCKKKSDGTYAKVCESENPGAPDGCVITDADLNGANPGIDKPLVGPGTFKLYVLNCLFSTACQGAPGAAPTPYVAVWK